MGLIAYMVALLWPCCGIGGLAASTHQWQAHRIDARLGESYKCEESFWERPDKCENESEQPLGSLSFQTSLAVIAVNKNPAVPPVV